MLRGLLTSLLPLSACPCWRLETKLPAPILHPENTQSVVSGWGLLCQGQPLLTLPNPFLAFLPLHAVLCPLQGALPWGQGYEMQLSSLLGQQAL